MLLTSKLKIQVSGDHNIINTNKYVAVCLLIFKNYEINNSQFKC